MVEKERSKEASCADDAVGGENLGCETVTTAIVGDVDVLLAGGAIERCDGEEAGQQRWVGKGSFDSEGRRGGLGSRGRNGRAMATFECK